MDIFREAVSKNKRRFKEDGYNLDLSYISSDFLKSISHPESSSSPPQLIAMGYPAKRIEASYRNRFDDVLRFLEERHPGHYKVFNLCTERKYALDSFGSRTVVEDYGFEDHKPPQFQSINLFCKEVEKYLRNKDNVAVIHCKAGKGRTGVMICCYLIHITMMNPEKNGGWNQWESKHTSSTAAIEALVDAVLQHFSRERTHDSKGVTIPSQRRYVELYALYLLSSVILARYDQKKHQHRTFRALESVSLTHNSSPGYWSMEMGFRLPHELPCHQDKPIDFEATSWRQQNQHFFNNEVVLDTANLEKLFSYSHTTVGPDSIHCWQPNMGQKSAFLLHEDFYIKFRRKDQFEFEFWFNASFVNEGNMLRPGNYKFFHLLPSPISATNNTSSADHRRHQRKDACASSKPAASIAETDKRFLVLQKIHIDRIYKSKFDEKFSNCKIVCQFGNERGLDRHTWRTFFTKFARPLQAQKHKGGGVWNVIACTINGYSTKTFWSGHEHDREDGAASAKNDRTAAGGHSGGSSAMGMSPNAPGFTLSRSSRALSASQPNLLAAAASLEESSYQFIDNSPERVPGLKLEAQMGRDKGSLRREDSCEQRMKDIDDDDTNSEDEFDDREMNSACSLSPFAYKRGDIYRSSAREGSSHYITNQLTQSLNYPMQTSKVPTSIASTHHRSMDPGTVSSHKNTSRSTAADKAHNRSHSIENSAAMAALASYHSDNATAAASRQKLRPATKDKQDCPNSQAIKTTSVYTTPPRASLATDTAAISSNRSSRIPAPTTALNPAPQISEAVPRTTATSHEDLTSRSKQEHLHKTMAVVNDSGSEKEIQTSSAATAGQDKKENEAQSSSSSSSSASSTSAPASKTVYTVTITREEREALSSTEC